MPTDKKSAGHYEEADWTDPKTQAMFGLVRQGRNLMADDVVVHTLDDQELAQCEAKEKEPAS